MADYSAASMVVAMVGRKAAHLVEQKAASWVDNWAAPKAAD